MGRLCKHGFLPKKVGLFLIFTLSVQRTGIISQQHLPWSTCKKYVPSRSRVAVPTFAGRRRGSAAKPALARRLETSHHRKSRHSAAALPCHIYKHATWGHCRTLDIRDRAVP